MKRKLLSLLVLLMTAISCAWAQGEYQQGEYLYLDISGPTAKLKCSPSIPSSGIPCYYYNNYNTSWHANDYNGFDAFRSSCTTITVDATCGGFNGDDLSRLFEGFVELTTISGIGNLNTSSVTDMGAMFYGCGSLTTLDLSGWNTSSVNSMSGMFSGCSNLSSLNLSNWNTGSVEDMSDMFNNCQNLSAIIGIGSLNTSSVTDMGTMFNDCSGLTSLDLSGWNTANVENMFGLFSGCSNLSSLNLSGWNTAKVEFMDNMFSGCKKLKKIYVGDGWSTERVWNNDNDMFSGCTSLPGWNRVEPVTDVSMAKTTDKGGYLTIATYNLTAKQGATDEYWATFYSEMSNYQASDGTQVFAVNLTGTEITMIEITDGIIKSSEGVVLKSTSNSITLTPTITASTGNYTNNSLMGTLTEITPGENDYYVLNKKGAGIGFYKLSNTGTIGANKAYLIYPDPQAGPGNTREFFGFEEATGLKAIDNGQLTIDNVVYDLQGRRVQNPTKGLYIVNGKKVVIK